MRLFSSRSRSSAPRSSGPSSPLSLSFRSFSLRSYSYPARLAFAGLVAATTFAGVRMADAHRQDAMMQPPASTGRLLTPTGQQTNVGSFPANMALSPDGKYIAVTNTGFRQYLSILSADDGHLVSQLPFIPAANDRSDKTSLYYGLAFDAPADGQAAGTYRLFASRGPQDKVSVFTVSGEGVIAALSDINTPSPLPAATKDAQPNFPAGIGVSAGHLYIANNETSAYTDFKGSVSVVDSKAGVVVGKITTAGFPYAVCAVTKGDSAGKKVYISSEQDGCVSVLDVSDPANGKHVRDIQTGDHPMALLLDADQKRLFVANASSDTVSEIDTNTDKVTRTWNARGKSNLPGATPTALALSPDQSRLYVTLADHNALAVIDLNSPKNEPIGLIPTGWYPTSVVVSPDGKRLFVANAKGARTRNPNGSSAQTKNRERYILNIIEGTVSMIATPTDADLRGLTQTAMRANAAGDSRKLPATGIKHVIYIIKENRTYDEILGDEPTGNGDKSLVLFGRDVTPNQHALAERFVLLDNFYCAAEVSADGWNWSVSGMGSEYNERNVPFNYSGRGRDYDFEGQINGTPVDLVGKPDVNRAPGGYIWDGVAKKGLSYRDYGFYVAFADAKTPDGKLITKDNTPVKKALVGHTDTDFRQFDMNYPDSDAHLAYNVSAPRQTKTYGQHNAPSRCAEWKREFDEFVRTDSLPRFEMVRLPRDHTSGTRAGNSSPRAMIADNDYAVGQLVEAVSKSKYWKETAIFILEDDAQDGIDHVDAHRSPAYVISPCIRPGTIDSHFYNTDSVLHTMEALLGIPPMCQYDANAPLIAAFTNAPANDAPYTAILPARAIIGEVNGRTAYRAGDSAKLDFARADHVPDATLNDILWHSVKGAHTPLPVSRHTLRVPAASHKDADD